MQQLSTGVFHYVVAQRFTPTMERTVEYLNATMSAARFYAVEPAKPEWASAYYLDPDTIIPHRHQIADILAELVRQVSEEA